ncbi:MAG: FkbM family methyltransferase [Gammaproteobacteria bacterium]|nr:FkbM family methyltransferase [Gammaproteobacteria bacterium]
MQIDSMEQWINHHIKSRTLMTEKSVILDIGAYHGDFTSCLLSSDIEKAILFEANQDNFDLLENTFKNNEKVKVVKSAIGDREGELQFYCDNDLATGSILPYQYKSDDASDVKQQRVKLTTIDAYFTQNPLFQPIALIKTDTQGNDLNVLKGAEQIIKSHRPWIVIELIFVPLYKNQGNPHEIASWLAKQGYTQSGMFNIHYTADGWMAFADGIFIPDEITQSFEMSFHMNPSNAELIAENIMLKNACEERLQLINRLHLEANPPIIKAKDNTVD